MPKAVFQQDHRFAITDLTCYPLSISSFHFIATANSIKMKAHFTSKPWADEFDMSYDHTEIINLAKRAGEAIMQIYQQPLAVESKADHSPLTAADLAAHQVIVDGLAALTPDIPVLSEESSAAQIAERFSWQRYWLIDPLDGTKEFIKRNGEFTVNIAFVENHCATFGVVYAPVQDLCYWGDKAGAFKSQHGEPAQGIAVSEPPQGSECWRIVGSRSHQTPAFKAFVTALPKTDLVAMGSSLKLCLVAEGRADLYPRFGPTSEWDTAAAHAIVSAAGGQVLNLATLSPLTYNTRADTLLNPEFIVCAAISGLWAP